MAGAARVSNTSLLDLKHNKAGLQLASQDMEYFMAANAINAAKLFGTQVLARRCIEC